MLILTQGSAHMFCLSPVLLNRFSSLNFRNMFRKSIRSVREINNTLNVLWEYDEKTGIVCIHVTLTCVRVTTVAVEKQ
jgi:hypothetical protein